MKKLLIRILLTSLCVVALAQKNVEHQQQIFRVGDELMVNVGENIVHNFFDQNRFFTGIIVVLGPAFNMEAGYINWFQQQKSRVDYYNRDIFAFNLQHTIESKRTP